MAPGIELKLERIRAGLTQRQMCDRLHVSRTTLWAKYERPTGDVDPELERKYREALTSPDTTTGDPT